MPENSLLDIDANNKTVAMLMKLFATSIAANSLFGFLRSKNTSRCFLILDFDNSSNSEDDNEKKATSAPEIMAEKNNNNPRNKSFNSSNKSGVATSVSILWGSVSTVWLY